ncbi:MAG: SLC13 family permease [Gammaproteobacteria bacterium]
MPSLPDLHAIFVLLLTPLALYLFTRDKLPLESSGLAILISLILFFQIFPYNIDGKTLGPAGFLVGFGHEALVTICALMIISKGLETTGALQPVALYLAKAWVATPKLASLVTLVSAAVLSAFLNNTPIVVILLPMLVGVAARSRIPPSDILMPVGFATLLGGMATTIGTSTNLLVVAIAADLGLPEFKMFDFALPVLLVGIVGLLYLWLIAPKLLPARTPPLSDTSLRVFDAMLHISEESTCCGMTFSECLTLTDNEMRVDRIERGRGLSVTKLPSVTILPGDRLSVRDTPDRLKAFETALGANLHAEHSAEGADEEWATDAEQQLAEIVVTRESLLHRASLTTTRFAQRTGLLPLALHRARAPGSPEIRGNIGSVRLRAGDVVLVQGTQFQLGRLKRSGSALVLDGTINLPRKNQANRSLAIITIVVLTAALGILPISVSALMGVAFMLATRCLSWADAAGALSTQVIIIVVTSLALGLALMQTGGALYIAEVLVAGVHGLPTPIIVSTLILVMAVLTNTVSNNAAGVIGTPIAIEMAMLLNAPPEPFVLAVIFGVNMSYATPFGYQTNLLLLSAGGYKFSDFMRVGIPLTVIMWLGFSIALTLLYGL